MDHFKLVSKYKPTGDQPQAIEQLVKGFKEGNRGETGYHAADRRCNEHQYKEMGWNAVDHMVG